MSFMSPNAFDRLLETDMDGHLLDLSGEPTAWNALDLEVPAGTASATVSFPEALPGDYCTMADPRTIESGDQRCVCYDKILLIRGGRLVAEKSVGYLILD